MKEPILITGCARSGTSLTAGVIDKCGAWGGEICGPTNANPKGQFENRVVVNTAIKPFLRTVGADPMGQFPLPDINHIIIQRGSARFWREKIMNIFISQGLKSPMKWYYKGAKICLIWPLWHRAFPGAKWIWVQRDPAGIINSCLKTHFMRAFDGPDGWKWWIDQHQNRFREMSVCTGLDMVVVHPEKMINGDFSEMKAVINWLGLTWSDKAQDFVDKSLWHYRTKQNATYMEGEGHD